MKYLIYILVFLITCCSVFRRSTKTTDENVQSSRFKSNFSTEIEAQKSKKMQYFTFKHDSIQADYTVRLWPKGNINFSGSEGFTGSFDSILITGKRQGSLNSINRLNVDEKGGLKTNRNLQTDQNEKSVQKQIVAMNSPNVKWIIISTVIFLIVAVLVFRRFFHKR